MFWMESFWIPTISSQWVSSISDESPVYRDIYIQHKQCALNSDTYRAAKQFNLQKKGKKNQALKLQL